MGTGASQLKSKPDVRTELAASDEFRIRCFQTFKQADVYNTGMLTAEEIWPLLTQDGIGLQLSQEQIETLIALSKLQPDDVVKYQTFVSTLQKLLQKLFKKEKTSFNPGSTAEDWCMITNGGENGLPLFMNKITGEVQNKAPHIANQNSPFEEVTFEYFNLPNGNEVTTYMTEEGRLYLDFDTDQWRPIPEEWVEFIPQDSDEPDFSEMYDDPRFGEYEHPELGQMYLYLMESPRNTYLYMDTDSGEWHHLPLAWERSIPAVQQQLKELDRLFPEWHNINEQLLVLKECNYDINEAIVFADMNWNFTGRCDLNRFTPAQLVRSGSIVDYAKKGRRTKAHSGNNSTTNGVSDGNGLSVSAAETIDKLQKQLRRKDKLVRQLRASNVEQEGNHVRALVREKTRVQTVADRNLREAMEAQEVVGDLQYECEQWRQKAMDLEEQLIRFRAGNETIVALQDEVESLRSGNNRQLLEKKDREIERLRMDNVGLKLKIQDIQKRLEDPSKNEQTVKFINRIRSKVQQLRAEKEASEVELKANLQNLNRLFSLSMAQAKKLHDDVHFRIKEIRSKYLKEQMARKLLYNKVQELKGNIRVFLRVRKDTRGKSIFKFPEDNECLLPTIAGGTATFEFDQCYGPETTQEQVFTDTKPLILSCVDGYNVCIMAYGQTGSGKTFTMMGPPSNPGVNRRAIRELLALCDSKEEVDYTISVSLLEVYNEKVYDLLSASRKKTLSIHSSVQGTYVGNLIEIDVNTVKDIERIMAKGDKNRSQAATKMNTDSSRSHLLLQLKVTGYNNISNTTTVGKLTLVDLAGSERVSKSEASGERLVEAAAINKSLSALGHVFKSLASDSPHIPYRNSKLTHVLQDSLGGDSKTAVFVNVSPLDMNLPETHCTLNFGAGIRNIELGPATKHSNRGAGKGGNNTNSNNKKSRKSGKKMPPPQITRHLSAQFAARKRK
eukprot:m.89061 g.89061  ORF g.89061 m.89061 type:complete len:952 (+) comp12283_c0_seq1:93-2948(+)